MRQNLVQRMKNDFEDTQLFLKRVSKSISVFQYAFTLKILDLKNHVQEKTTSIFYLRATLQSWTLT